MAAVDNRRPDHDNDSVVGRAVLAVRSPGEMLLEEFLEPLELKQTEAANRMRIPVNRRITASDAQRLSRLLDPSPQFCTRLRADWDSAQARAAPRHTPSGDRAMMQRHVTDRLDKDSSESSRANNRSTQ